MGGPEVRVNPSAAGDPTKGWDPGVEVLIPKEAGNSTEKEGERLSCGWEPRRGGPPSLVVAKDAARNSVQDPGTVLPATFH